MCRGEWLWEGWAEWVLLASKSILKEFTNHAYYALTYIIMHNTISSVIVLHPVALSIGGYWGVLWPILPLNNIIITDYLNCQVIPRGICVNVVWVLETLLVELKRVNVLPLMARMVSVDIMGIPRSSWVILNIQITSPRTHWWVRENRRSCWNDA